MMMAREQRPFYWGTALLGLLLIGTGIYAYLRMNALDRRLDTLTQNVQLLADDLSSTTADLQSSIKQTDASLSSSLSAQQQNLGSIQQQLGGVQGQVGNLSGTVSTIQKLSQIDPELLKKYSKVYFLNENYVPASLLEIPLAYQYSDSAQLLFLTQALPHLLSMIDAASSTGVTIYVDSAYRSFDDQKALKSEYDMIYGAGTANSFSADQGYSEHQLGTAVDLITPGFGGQLTDAFDGSAAYAWLAANAYKYGFILSYPKDNTYYEYEPWHWRFVGVKLATDLHDKGLEFYEEDQRTLDTYLVNIFD